MATHGEQAHASYARSVGEESGVGDWLTVTQDRINAFAEVTEDRQFIHVDPEACKEASPFGVPIAHGFLTLSLLTKLMESVPQDPQRLEGIAMGLNYGFDKVRFLNPVKVDTRIRARAVLAAADLKDPNTIQVTQTITVEIDGESKPALVADWITRYVYS